MTRLLAAALAASLLSAASARAQTQEQKPAAGKPTGQAATTEADPKLQEAVRREVARVKDELREEVRAELQGAQAEAAFLGTEEKPKLQFLELNGYLRFRADLLDNLDLHRDPDPSGYFLYPRPIIGNNSASGATQHGTLTSANMRFRLEPTLNVSEQVRVRSQVDMLDNLVLGSTPESSQYNPNHFGSGNQVPPQSSIAVKRAWAEVQTPLGLLSFGRMPSQWGLGILANPGSGLDDDFGDTVDRIQFAIPVPTPIGSLVFIPHWDFVWSGLTSQYTGNAGLGQPFDRDQADDGRGIGLKILKIDSKDEMKRKFDKNLSSFNYGLWWSYKSQTFDFPCPSSTPFCTSPNDPAIDPSKSSQIGSVRIDGSAHVLDLWTRYETKKLRLEFEGTALYGQMNDPNVPPGPVLLRQFGAALQGVAKLSEGRVQLGGEIGFASGDDNPGFGNLPGRGVPQRYDIDGRQYAVGDKIVDVRNFRFNRAYRIDMILWREILGGVTDAWYVKPTLRWEFLEGLVGTAQIVYSQAIYASSTPSDINKPLGLEGDIGLSYTSDDGFVAWLNYGMLIPFSGLEYGDKPGGGTSLSRAHALRAGLAVKF